MGKGFIIGVSTVVALGIIATFILLHLYSRLPDPDWAQIKKRISHDFPDVPGITTAELAGSIEAGTRLVLVDARAADEFTVSHIPGAIRAESVEEVEAVTARDAEIVVYCSVGYRSGDLASKLRESGFTHVRNLEGSIFAWANERRPLADADESRTHLVHPYNEHWGKLLDEELRFPLD